MEENSELDVKLKNKKERKIKNILDVLEGMMLTIIILILYMFVRKVCLLYDISNKVGKLDEISNYYVRINEYGNTGFVTIGETYYKDNGNLTNMTWISGENGTQTKIIIYKDANDDKALNYRKLENDNKLELMESTDNMIIQIKSKRLNFNMNSLKNIIKALKDIKDIDTVIYDEIKCYCINFYDGSQVYLEKDTGLPIREIIVSNYRKDIEVRDYTCMINSVTDKDFDIIN